MPTLPSTTTGRMIQAASLLLAVNLAFTACGGSADSAPAEGGVSDESVTSTVEDEVPRDSSGDQAGEESETAEDAPGTPQPAVSLPDEDSEDDPAGQEPVEDDVVVGVPGDPLDFGPEAGTPLLVLGVAFDDVLNFRVDPDPTSEILAIAVPTAEVEILALGEAWAAPSGVWWKVSVDGQDAWANQKYLGGPGTPVDIFDPVDTDLTTLEYDTIEDAARAVATTRASTDPASRIVFATEPLAFDAVGGFVVIDVLDLGDDSVKGERLRLEVEFIFDQDGEDGAQDLVGVTVTSVEATPICGRGVAEGLCV